MVEITIYKTVNHDYIGFDVKGHAGFEDPGKDILCAAISILVMNTINAIERYTKDEITVVQDDVEGNIELRFAHVAGHDAHLLLHTMLLGLTELADDEDYEPYIDINYKEV